MRRGALLDRDGTLIDFHRDPDLGAVVSAFHPDQIRLYPGVVEGLRTLRDAGFTLAIATNQPGAAKGQVPWQAIERTNRALVDRLAAEGIAIASVAVCPHHPEGGAGGDPALARACDCRKPAPGMLVRLVRELELDAGESWMIGDGQIDVEAAHAAGLHAALLLDTHRCELCPLRHELRHEHGCAHVTPIPDLVDARLDLLAAAICARL